MSVTSFKVLFFSDSHLGFDYPISGKKTTVRRGFDFFRNFYTILDAAKQELVDLVIHGGDLFHRSKVPAKIVNQAYDAIFTLADTGIPIVIVPGNHDRSTLPVSLFLHHPNIHVFREPRVFSFSLNGIDLNVAGFPFVRKIGREITAILDPFCHRIKGDLSVLCMHQAISGATVGPVDFTFKAGPEVIGHDQLMGWPFAAILSGHIHRYQVLKIPSSNKGIDVPFIYSGSIERTAFAERYEDKGYLILEFDSSGLSSMEFKSLPSRSMHVLWIDEQLHRREDLAQFIRAETVSFQPDAAISISSPTQFISKSLSRSFLKELLPEEMHVQIRHQWLRD